MKKCSPTRALIWCVATAIVLACIGWRLLCFAVENGAGAGAYAFYGVSLVLMAGLLIAHPFARLCYLCFPNFFYSLEYFNKPQAMYSIPEARRQEGDFDAAFAAYSAIVEEHPQAVKAYAGMIEIAILELENPEFGLQLFKRGKETLKKQEDLEILTRHYRESRERAAYRKKRAQPNRRIALPR